MKMHQHAAISIGVSGVFWLATQSVSGTLACFLAGILIDLDHIIDYLFNYGLPFKPKRFFRVFEFEVADNIFVFLHSWEMMLLGLAILWVMDGKPVLLGLFVGGLSHLALDHFFNHHSPWAYFFAYRLRHRFSGKHYYGAREYRQRLKSQRNGEVEKPAAK